MGYRHDETPAGALCQMKASLLHSARLRGPDQRDRQGAGRHRVPPGGSDQCQRIFLKLVGYTLEDVRGKNYSMSSTPRCRYPELPGFWPALARGEAAK
jgi:hypothetical protein